MSAFRSLAELFDQTYADTNSPQCPYIVRTGGPCRNWMSLKVSEKTKSIVAEYLGIFTGSFRESTNAAPPFQFFQMIANINLCKNHKKHANHATEQWLNEFTEERSSIIGKLKEYCSLGSHDTHAGENGDYADEIDSSANKPYCDNGGSDDEKRPSEGREGVSTLSSQSSSPIGVLRRSATLAEEEVGKKLTCLLEKRAEGNSQKPGWIYALRPLNLPGKVKIGYTLETPRFQRLQYHKRCTSFGDYEVLIAELIPHAYRVEQLVLTEFSNEHYQLENRCKSCEAIHKELLDIDSEKLLTCLRKWIDFVKSSPYNKEGQLTKEAKDNIPLPAKSEFLGYKPKRGRTSRGTTPKKKSGGQDSQTPPPSKLDFTATTKNSTVHGAELSQDQDEICSALENLQLTPSKQTGGFMTRLLSIAGSFYSP
ncbi:hypothetical protein N7532_009792 [Penicillium argentinense]|uniref:Bacteriophage T5 Orf172 DNA-binding domain-containing protein n=1 Tax=Penicillium argentinense TaxID=1131581 RepID=A0A9W9JXI4_9EURO|nr:uncharacterized protein N7532_009792 [Penicillium argentinense]KAJ5085021.1 hypothetical protein N7532_009792 [Penicillium argentinense]